MIKIKSYVKLNIAALHRRLARPYGLWLLARLLDTRGQGKVRAIDLRRAACKYMHCHRQTVWRALQKQTDFWLPCNQPGWIRYIGVRELAQLWDIDLERHPVFIDLTELSTLQGLRAALLNTLFAGKARTISQARLGQLIDRVPRSIRHYLDSPALEKQHNIMVREANPPPLDVPLDPDLAKTGHFRGNINGRLRLLKRLPNTYFNPRADTAPFGLVKYSYKGSSLPKGSPRRLYFTKSAAARRAIERLIEGERIFCQLDGKTDAYGRLLWQGWERTFEVTQAC